MSRAVGEGAEEAHVVSTVGKAARARSRKGAQTE